jgi:hypothetical protein
VSLFATIVAAILVAAIIIAFARGVKLSPITRIAIVVGFFVWLIWMWQTGTPQP